MIKKHYLLILVTITSSISCMDLDISCCSTDRKEVYKQEIARAQKKEYDSLFALVQERIAKKEDLNLPIMSDLFIYKTPLIKACDHGDQYLPITQLLLDHGADPNKVYHEGWPPLHHAVGNFAIETVKLLLQAKPVPANPDTVHCLWGGLSHNICIPARDQIDSEEKAIKRVKIAKILLKSGVNPNNPEDTSGYTYLHRVITNSYNMRTGVDALHGTTKEQQELFFKQRKALIRILLEHGGSLAIRDRSGKTSIQQAYESDDHEANQKVYRELAQYAFNYSTNLRKKLLFLLGHAGAHPMHETPFKAFPKDLVRLIIDKTYPCPPKLPVQQSKDAK